MKAYLTRERAIAYDITDPTPWERPKSDILYSNYDPVVCPFCGREIRLQDDVVHFCLGRDKKYCHEKCLDEQCPAFEDLFDALGIDYTYDTGEWFADRM